MRLRVESRDAGQCGGNGERWQGRESIGLVNFLDPCKLMGCTDLFNASAVFFTFFTSSQWAYCGRVEIKVRFRNLLMAKT